LSGWKLGKRWASLNECDNRPLELQQGLAFTMQVLENIIERSKISESQSARQLTMVLSMLAHEQQRPGRDDQQISIGIAEASRSIAEGWNLNEDAGNRYHVLSPGDIGIFHIRDASFRLGAEWKQSYQSGNIGLFYVRRRLDDLDDRCLVAMATWSDTTSCWIRWYHDGRESMLRLSLATQCQKVEGRRTESCDHGAIRWRIVQDCSSRSESESEAKIASAYLGSSYESLEALEA
jgi:hypothetical protein